MKRLEIIRIDFKLQLKPPFHLFLELLGNRQGKMLKFSISVEEIMKNVGDLKVPTGIEENAKKGVLLVGGKGIPMESNGSIILSCLDVFKIVELGTKMGVVFGVDNPIELNRVG